MTRRYCFRCPDCGYPVETTTTDPPPVCCFNELNGAFHDVLMVRDYRAEAVGIGPGVRNA